MKIVNKKELVQILGRMCSPYPGYDYYIIGKLPNGRLAHLASCRTYYDAKQFLKEHSK